MNSKYLLVFVILVVVVAIYSQVDAASSGSSSKSKSLIIGHTRFNKTHLFDLICCLRFEKFKTARCEQWRKA